MSCGTRPSRKPPSCQADAPRNKARGCPRAKSTTESTPSAGRPVEASASRASGSDKGSSGMGCSDPTRPAAARQTVLGARSPATNVTVPCPARGSRRWGSAPSAARRRSTSSTSTTVPAAARSVRANRSSCPAVSAASISTTGCSRVRASAAKRCSSAVLPMPTGPYTYSTVVARAGARDNWRARMNAASGPVRPAKEGGCITVVVETPQNVIEITAGARGGRWRS